MVAGAATNDCPYNAISLVARSDSRAFEREPIVNPAFCVSCGLCAGSCPTSMPFRRLSDLSPGIDMPDRTISALREETEAAAAGLTGPDRIMVFGCDSGPAHAKLKTDTIGTVSLTCIGQLPPAFIDYVLSRDLADGVVLTGCSENSCQARFGEMDRRKAGRTARPASAQACPTGACADRLGRRDRPGAAARRGGGIRTRPERLRAKAAHPAKAGTR